MCAEDSSVYFEHFLSEACSVTKPAVDRKCSKYTELSSMYIRLPFRNVFARIMAQ